ncbi:YdcF family protein [Shouchella sp. 1P09AA]|uniref:YdcF family protein n=1 Tax=unclassified Shouchella TaxID=2893065 RepID=UPI00399F7885
MLKISKWVSLLIVLAVASLVVYSAISILTQATKNELEQTDAAIVLGAAVWDDESSPVFQERIHHAVWLYNNGYVDKLIFTGGRSEGDRYAESEVGRQVAMDNGVPSAHIYLEQKSTITEENLAYAQEIAEQNEITHLTLVSDPLHMARSVRMAEDLGMEVYASPTQTSAYETLGSQIPFFTRELFYYVGYTIVAPFR